MGDDEASFALRALQLMVDDVTIFPPLVLDRDINRLISTSGQHLQLPSPVDSGIMIWDEGHWLGLVATYIPASQIWFISTTGLQQEDDVNPWYVAITYFLNVPISSTQWGATARNLRIPDACGFEAISFITTQVQNAWQWEPHRVLHFTGQAVVDTRINNHLQNLRQYLMLHSSPLYFTNMVLQIRAAFLSFVHHNVITRTIRLGRGRNATPLTDAELRTRQLLLLDRGVWMGHDEMQFILMECQTFPMPSSKRVEMPILWINDSQEPTFMETWTPDEKAVHYTFVMVHIHWVLLEVWGPTPDRPHFHFHFHHRYLYRFERFVHQLARLTGWHTSIYDTSITFESSLHPTLGCGSFAAARLASMLGLQMTPNEMTNELARANPDWTHDETPFEAYKIARLDLTGKQWMWGIIWRDRFTRALRTYGFRDAIFHGGAMLTDEQIRTFTDLLQQHGVPPKAVQDRIYQLLQKLTSETVAQALQTRWPWTKLKQLATEKGTRLVLQEELEQHVQTRKAKGPGSRQTKRAKPAEPITSLPLQLFELPENHFQDDKQQPLPVLSPDQVKHAATGVALMTADQVEPLLSHPPLSAQPLAVLTHNVDPTSIQAHHDFSTLKLALTYQPTGEKVLCTLQCLQLGKTPVQYAPPCRSATTAAIATTPVRFMWYKDQAHVDWTTITQNPVKAFLASVPALADCERSGCSCGAWHSADANIPLILSVFDRQWLAMDFTRTTPSMAKVFAVMVRIPTQALAHIQLQTGHNGFYADPKEDDHRTPSQLYAVQWLAKKNLDDLQTLRRLHPTIVGIARAGHRYGARTNTADAEALHQTLFPQDIFVGEKGRKSYHLYPLPWGTTKSTMQKLLATWKWTAKPVATAGAKPEGMIWMVVSQEAPPNDQLALKDHLILIKEITRTPKEPALRPGTLIASTQTCTHLRNQQGQKPAEESLLKFDPWANYQKGSTSASPATIQAVQKALESRIDIKLKQTHPNPVPTGVTPDPKVLKLEEDMKQLQQQTQQMQHDFKGFTKEVDTRFGSIQKDFKNELQKQLGDQMTQLTQLLAQKQ